MTHPTDEELDAPSDPVSHAYIVDGQCDHTITALRAKLAEADLAALSDPLVVHMNMLNGRIAKPSVNGIVHIYAGELVSLEQLQAALAAQIEADAGIADSHNYGFMSMTDADMRAVTIVNAIRNQPHDRTALDRMLLAEREKALREAAEYVGKASNTFPDNIAWAVEDLANAILTMIEHQ